MNIVKKGKENMKNKMNETNKKNRKITICILAVIIIVAIIVVSLWRYINRNSNMVNGNDISSKNILIEYSYQNYAWEYKYSGTIICEDGSIYTFKFENPESNEANDTIEKTSENILKHIIENKGTMNKNDLRQLKEELLTINDDTTSKPVANDMGQASIEYYNYDTNEIITLRSTGDLDIQNNSQNIENVFEILQKYDLQYSI